ncbi:long-chain-fatty-acid--CoA ligase [Engelhardtia mirabilis]|uniref:Long-chain-fatty-acid--CoA ligase n=1 Tax=Engelhardtia mirabilis TaxID=2528011 RepID=A0A518BN34_9BACT|nr:Long-chain-fatty-acid--CoA ligase [Planctomycetes bacterium Pla133]QDV02693.1 Long-chain-fatty-acid--CoA ligase [Planctomycetes bacterium Pla86]
MQERIWHGHYDSGVPTSLDYDQGTLTAMLRRSIDGNGPRPAVTFINRTLTFAELGADVARMANALRGLGVREGTTVGIMAPNLPQTVIAYHAALAAGAKVALTNPLYTAPEIEHQWNDAQVEVAFVADFLYASTVAKVRSKVNAKHFVILSIPEYLKFPLNLLAPFKLRKQDPPAIAKVPDGPGIHRFKQLLSGQSTSFPEISSTAEDIAVLQYTGGTTGRSKGAVLSHHNLTSNVQQLVAWINSDQPHDEVILTALPLFHVFGMTVAMNLALSMGAHQVLQPNPRDIPTVVKLIAKHRVSLFPGVPALFANINKLPNIGDFDLSSVRVCVSGSAPLPSDVQTKFERLTGGKILEGFGMTETSPVTHANPFHGTRKIGTIGIPLSDTDAKIVAVEDDAQVMPVGEAGQLLVRGPQVMQGYWQQPEASAEALAGGWMHTGDLAVMDEQGYFKIVGRTKDMISVGGLKVFPDEVDDVLHDHPSILEAATIGLPKPSGNEYVKSFVVLEAGKTMTAEEVITHCAERLAPYKVPSEVEFIPELPRSSVMKILRRELRDRELGKQRGDGQAGLPG